MRTVICGAGISGLALAHLLAAHGGEVVVVERAPGPRPQGYMIDFFGPGLVAVEAMGLLPAFERAAYHYDEGHLVDRNGRRRATLRTKSFSRGPLLSLMRPDIEAVLRENLPAEVELRYGATLTEVANRTDGVAVTLEDGTVVDADLLVGADGIHSTVRRLVFGPEDRYLRYLGLHTAAFTFDAPDVHAATERAFCLTDSVDRQLGFYALRDGRVATFAVHRSADPTIPDDPRVTIQQVYTGLGWVTPRALAQCPPAEEIYYDQVAQVELPEWNTGRVVLLGDAASARRTRRSAGDEGRNQRAIDRALRCFSSTTGRHRRSNPAQARSTVGACASRSASRKAPEMPSEAPCPAISDTAHRPWPAGSSSSGAHNPNRWGSPA